jgi:hypothetical protein
MNGGFQKLAEQQSEQCETLKTLAEQQTDQTCRLSKVETWQLQFDRRFNRAIGIVGSLVLAVLGRLGYDLVQWMSAHLK